MHIRPIIHLALAALLSAGAPAQAAEHSWYDVEVWVFAHEERSALTSEYWDPALQPRLSSNARSLQRNDPQAPFFRLGEPTTLNYGGLLTPGRGYRPLFSARWRQPIPERNAVPVRIQGGQVLADGQPELVGEISLDRGRYLHLRTSLYLRLPLSEQTRVTLRPAAHNDTSAPTLTQADDQPLLQVASTRPSRLTVKMEQGRRMRSDEIHYLDHPLFGLLIRVTPYGS